MLRLAKAGLAALLVLTALNVLPVSAAPDRKTKDELFTDDVAKQVALQAGNAAKAVQIERAVRDITPENMRLLRLKMEQQTIVGPSQKMGKITENLFAYRHEQNLLRAGKMLPDRTIATDTTKYSGLPNNQSDPADLRAFRGDKFVPGSGAQVKTHMYPKSYWQNGKQNGGLIREGQYEKYKGLQITVLKDEDQAIREEFQRKIDEYTLKVKKGTITPQELDELNKLKATKDRIKDYYEEGGVRTSVSRREALEATVGKEKWIRKELVKANMREIGVTSLHMAASEGIMRGAMSGVSNLWQYANGEKSLGDAVQDTAIETAKGIAHGGTTGALSATFRIIGQTNGLELLQNSSLMTVVAAGLVDCGASVIDYALGRISAEQLQEQLIDTAGKGIVSVCITKGVAVVLGSTGGFAPIAAYAVASWVFTTTRDILRENRLTIEEARRVASLCEAARVQLEQNREQLEQLFASLKAERAASMRDFLVSFDAGVNAGNYEAMAASVAVFAANMHMSLQHTNFDDFSRDMTNPEYTFTF